MISLTTPPAMPGGRSAAHLFIHQRSGQRHHALDDQGARSVVRIAEENVCQHRADAARRKAIPWAQQPAGQQHEAVAQVHIALHRRGDLHDHRRHADKRRKQCGKDKLSDLFIVHDWVLLCFGCWPYYIPSWYYSYSQNKTNYADQICPKLEKKRRSQCCAAHWEGFSPPWSPRLRKAPWVPPQRALSLPRPSRWSPR